MIILGINGFKTSGKNTAYEFVRELLPDKNVVGVGFADRLKIVGLKTLGFDRSDAELLALADSFKAGACISTLYDEPDNPSTLFEDNALLHDLTGREFLQNFGQRAREEFGANFWVDLVLPIARDYDDITGYSFWRLDTGRYKGVDILCITDLRYPNEADRIKALGGVVWEIVRPGLESDGHSSEQPLPHELVDWQVLNDGGLLDLRDRVNEAIGETLDHA
jgi:hypothetical protein